MINGLTANGNPFRIDQRAVRSCIRYTRSSNYERILRTEGARRALAAASVHATLNNRRQVEPIDLLHAVLADEESPAVVLLAEFGMSDEARSQWLTGQSVAYRFTPSSHESTSDTVVGQSQALKMAVADAELYVRAVDRSRPMGTEEILYGLITSSKDVAREVQRLSVDMERLIAYFTIQSEQTMEMLPLPEGCEPLVLMDSVESADIARIIDAASNRVREGLRVIEDYARFAARRSLIDSWPKGCEASLEGRHDWLPRGAF